MTELEPFLDSCDDFERGLLRSVRGDAPSPDAASRTLVALRLEPAAHAAGVLGARSLGVWTILKSLGVGALVGGVVLAGAEHLAQRSTVGRTAAALASAASISKSTLAAPAASNLNLVRSLGAIAPVAAAKPSTGVKPPARHNASADAATSAQVSEPGVQAMTSSAVVAAPAPSSGPATANEAPGAVSIAEQVSVVDQARSALTHGRASEAVSYTRQYAQRWPNGALSIEAVIVRIEAELALGDRNSAERDAKTVIAARPGSRYVTRVRGLFSPPLVE